MNADTNAITHMRAITISREYGSGGGEIASRLAARLGWQLVDHEIVVRVAQELDIPLAEAEANDEYVESTVSRILTSMRMIYPTMSTVEPVPDLVLTDPQAYQDALSKVVNAAVTAGRVVIVGRGAQVLLANRRDVLHARVVAPLEQRIAYVMQREGLNRDAARGRIQLKESDRHRYLQAQYHRHSDDPHLYDLVLNTGVLSLDNAVDLIYQTLQYKAMRLAIVTGELGPVMGLEPYTSQPGDFHPPESK
ncbi:MAG TPA: cytidylate kinase-like family protein [Ktedonosporobacter sp.]|nr:cytidylate kinase-like family protein [Ktedonosporobacter sp.]